MTNQNQNSNNTSSTGSPWDEPLDVQEEKKKEVIGTLEGLPSESGGEIKASVKPVPFNIPEGIDDEKVGKKIPAEDIIEKEKTKLKLPPKEEATSAPVSVAKVDPAGKPVEEAKATAPMQAKETSKPIQGKPAVDNIARPEAKVLAENQQEIQPEAAMPPIQEAGINKIRKNITSPPPFKSSEAAVSPNQENEQVPPLEKPKGGFFSKINPFSKKKQLEAPKTTATSQTTPTATQPKTILKPVASTSKPSRKPIKIDFYRKPSFIVTASVILIFTALTFLTENGLISVGIEKVYGILGLEQLWGGLPRNPETALAKAFVNGKENLEFKAKGEITLTVDKTIESEITSPLVAVTDFIFLARDIQVGPRTKAILTQADYYYDDDYYDYDDSYYDYDSDYDYDDSSSSSSSSDSISNDSGSDSEDTSSIYDSSSQEDYQSYSSDVSSIKEVDADFKSVSGSDGTKTDFTINKVTGRSSSVSMITSQNDLYINTSSDIEYHSRAEDSKWLDYSISAPESENVLNDFYSLKTDNGFSIIGRRIANEKVSNLRCYRYQLDSLEIGSSLEFLGIESEMIQKVSGDVWIGIKDQLIRKIDVTLIPSISSSVSRIDLEVEFYDYGSSNIIETPRLDQKIAVSNEDIVEDDSISEEVQAEEDKGEIATSSTESERDNQRKSDLTEIKVALEEYYDDNGYYPVASNWSDINQSNSTLVIKLVPEYITAIPTDPKLSEGFYYGYESNGKSYTLSARFENLNDPQISNVGDDIWLHYVYSDN